MNAADDLHEVETIDPSELTFTRRAWVDATPADVYGLVSEVSLISRWSPNASDVAFDEGAGPEAGAWLSGRNRRNGTEWITRSQVVKAAPGVAFVFVVGGAENGIVEWTWTFQAGMPVAPWRPPPWSGPPRLPKVTVPSVRTRRRVVCRALIRHFLLVVRCRGSLVGIRTDPGSPRAH